MYAGLMLILAFSPGANKPRQFTPAAEVLLANAYVQTLPAEQQGYALFISLHAIPPADLVLYAQVTSGVINGLSDASVMVCPRVVPGSDGTLLYFDLTLTKIPRKALNKLARLGSGGAPFPDPFFHQQVKTLEYSEYGHWNYNNGRKEWVTTSRRPDPDKGTISVIAGPWLEPGITALSEATDASAPIFEVRWFWANALIEPRYHELLGLGDKLSDFEKLAHLDADGAEDLGSQVRGAVLDSEVGLRSRILERTPTLVRFGRGAFHQSFDFASSVNVKDVLKDVLIKKSDANESILTRRNGLQAYFLNDANGVRLDKAVADVAQDNRTRGKDHQVWSGWHCMGCHEPKNGIILVVDEVRSNATADLELVSKRYADGNHTRGQSILEKYFTIDLNELLVQDQKYFAAAIVAATTLPDYPQAKPLTCAAYSTALQNGIYFYLEQPVTLSELAVEVGYPELIVRGTIERNPGLDHSLVGMLKRPQRRDQVEAGVAPLFILLNLLPAEEH